MGSTESLPEEIIQQLEGSAAVPILASREVPPRSSSRGFLGNPDSRRRRMLALADATTALVFTTAFAWTQELDSRSTLAMVATVPLWILFAKLAGLYDNDHRTLRHLTADELPTLLLWVLVSSTATTLLVMQGASMSSDAVLSLVAGCTAAVCLRSMARASWRRAVAPSRVVLIGEGPLVAATRRKLELFRDIHATVVAEIPVEEARAIVRSSSDFAPGGVDRVIVATALPPNLLMDDLVGICRSRAIKLSLVQPPEGPYGRIVCVTRVAELAAFEYNTLDAPRSTLLLKRAGDLVVASVALILLLPLLAVIAVAIYSGDRGPVLFRQRRAGTAGKQFTIWKFRTMDVNAEERLQELVSFDELDEPVFKLDRDPRCTKVGRTLRRFSLDELPQLVNVLRGDMSMVGPRPEQIELVERYSPEQRLRLTVRPGVTGPMQIYGRGSLSLEERLAVELDYIENLSLGRDLGIMAHTLGPVLNGRGAS